MPFNQSPTPFPGSNIPSPLETLRQLMQMKQQSDQAAKMAEQQHKQELNRLQTQSNLAKEMAKFKHDLDVQMQAKQSEEAMKQAMQAFQGSGLQGLMQGPPGGQGIMPPIPPSVPMGGELGVNPPLPAQGGNLAGGSQPSFGAGPGGSMPGPGGGIPGAAADYYTRMGQTIPQGIIQQAIPLVPKQESALALAKEKRAQAAQDWKEFVDESRLTMEKRRLELSEDQAKDLRENHKLYVAKEERLREESSFKRIKMLEEERTALTNRILKTSDSLNVDIPEAIQTLASIDPKFQPYLDSLEEESPGVIWQILNLGGATSALGNFLFGTGKTKIKAPQRGRKVTKESEDPYFSE